ncbi:hypothetical protein ACVWYI_000312 [Bradyrhizobium sp. LB13.1]
MAGQTRRASGKSDRFSGRTHDVAVAMGRPSDFGGSLSELGVNRWPMTRREPRGSAIAARITGLPESSCCPQREVGPPDAVNTGGPVPLIKILAGKGGFAGQVRRRFDPSARPVRRNANRPLT